MIAVLARDFVYYYGLFCLLIHTVKATLWFTRRNSKSPTKSVNLNRDI